MMGFRDREDGQAPEPRVSAFSGFNLVGWFPIGSDVIWRGDETFARVMASGDVAYITYRQEVNEFAGGVNWVVIAKSQSFESVMSVLESVAAMQFGWRDYSKVIGWDCAEVKGTP